MNAQTVSQLSMEKKKAKILAYLNNEAPESRAETFRLVMECYEHLFEVTECRIGEGVSFADKAWDFLRATNIDRKFVLSILEAWNVRGNASHGLEWPLFTPPEDQAAAWAKFVALENQAMRGKF